MKRRYLLVAEANPNDLQSTVNNLLKYGWVPEGSAFYVDKPLGYHQTLVLLPRKPATTKPPITDYEQDGIILKIIKWCFAIGLLSFMAVQGRIILINLFHLINR